MSDADFPTERSSGQTYADTPSNDDVPQFGALDIVEAFTAMRHEWRGQTKESRSLAEQIQAAISEIQSLESKLLSHVADRRGADNGAGEAGEIRKLVLVIVEIDHQLSRAGSAIAQWEMNRCKREEADAKGVESYFAGMNRLARWFARPLLNFVTEHRSIPDSSVENPAIAGLNLVVAQLRRMMKDHGIERVDTEGQAFDADTMHAIGTVATVDCRSGHVAEQFSPAYRWQGRIIRFADVRVAK